MTLSLKLFAVGIGLELLFLLMLLLPGQNIHGSVLTGITLFIGIVPPPFFFIAGLAVALMRAGPRTRLGAILNAAGLLLYGLWISGGVGKLYDAVAVANALFRVGA